MGNDDNEIPTLAWMAYFACGPGHQMIDRFPPVGDGNCCWGALVRGPESCLCWQPVYDLNQQAPDATAVTLLRAGIEPTTRTTMCGDCAYRPNSPEKNSDPTYNGDPEFLERIARDAERFWCHQGMRRPLKWVHPSGQEIPGSDAAYDPPKAKVDNGFVPFKADGTPAELCAGWDARRRALASHTDLPDDHTCNKCLSCKQLAGGDDDRSPWSAWEQLPEESKLAIRLGFVYPIPCDHCSGSGVEPADPQRSAP
jgi:hypothetical protein